MSSPSVPQIILDTDPGGDDSFAFLWLLSLVKQGLAELVAVTTADGNVAAPQTFCNASQILHLTGSSEIEVGRGVLMKQPAAEDASHIHGSDGMGSLSKTLPAPTHDYAAARSSEDILIDRLQSHPGAITLVAIGPLTNLAAAEEKHPGILKLAKEIVIMGGAFLHPGNVTPQAEFNIWFNPEAAATVFNSRDDLVVIPLDVTRRLIFTKEMAQKVGQVAPGSPLVQFMTALCKFMTGTAMNYRETSRVPGFLVHDAATLAYLFYPETLLMQRAKVQVETQGEWTRGQTVCDRRLCAKPNANAWVALQVNETRFFTCFLEDLKLLLR
jgi:inosine-uridine nucleoside N-ribohydrolase